MYPLFHEEEPSHKSPSPGPSRCIIGLPESVARGFPLHTITAPVIANPLMNQNMTRHSAPKHYFPTEVRTSFASFLGMSHFIIRPSTSNALS